APDGSFGMTVERGMTPGNYRIRVDDVEAGSGKVLTRAEVPFTMEAAAPKPAAPAAVVTAPADTRQKVAALDVKPTQGGVAAPNPLPAPKPVVSKPASPQQPKPAVSQPVPAPAASAAPVPVTHDAGPSESVPVKPAPATPAPATRDVALPQPVP